MQQYMDIMEIIGTAYVVSSFVFLFSPLHALSFFVFFRAMLSIAAHLKVQSIIGGFYFGPGLLMLVLQFAITISKKKIKLKLESPIIAYCIFLALTLLIVIFFVTEGQDKVSNFEELSKLFLPMLAYFFVYFGVTCPVDIKKCTKYILLAGLLPIMVGTFEVAFGVGYSLLADAYVQGSRPVGALVDPNLYGIFLSLNVFLLLPSILQRKCSRLSVMYMIILICMVIASKNRGTWISISFALCVSAFIFRRHLNLLKWFTCIAIVMLLAAPKLASRFDELNTYDEWGQKQDTATGRYHHALAIFTLAMKSPLIGNGPGAYDIGLRGGDGHIVLPHNDYARIAVQYGFPTMLVYLLFIFLQMRWASKRRGECLWEYQFSSYACSAYLILISMVQNVLTDTSSYMLIFIIFALSHRASGIGHDSRQGTTVATPETQSSRIAFLKARTH